MAKTRKRKERFICANPMVVRFCCTSCHWTKDVKGDEARPMECPSCKQPVKIVLE
jgi:hypothetical protein